MGIKEITATRKSNLYKEYEPTGLSALGTMMARLIFLVVATLFISIIYLVYLLDTTFWDKEITAEKYQTLIQQSEENPGFRSMYVQYLQNDGKISCREYSIIQSKYKEHIQKKLRKKLKEYHVN